MMYFYPTFYAQLILVTITFLLRFTRFLPQSAGLITALCFCLPLATTAKSSTDSLEQLQQYIALSKRGTETENQPDSTYFYLLEAQQLATDLGADSLLAEIRNSLAYFLQTKGKTQAALKQYHTSIHYAQQVSDTFLLMRTYISIGNDYEAIQTGRRSLDSLIFYTQQGLALAEKRNDILHSIIAKQSLAAYYYEIPNRKAEALVLLRESLKQADLHPEGVYFKAPAFRQLATFYLAQKDYAQALELLQKSLQHGEEHESSGFLLTTWQDLQQLYEEMGDYQQSLAAYKQVAFYKEKLSSQAVDNKISELEIKFAAAQKENQINQLQLQNERAVERSHRQRLLLTILLIGGALIGGLAYLNFKNYRNKQQAFVQLAKNQEEVAAFKARFYTNLTHELRTPLTVIQGMTQRIKGNPDAKNMIQRNSEQLLQLVNQMLDLQKLDAGALTYQYIQADVMTYLRYLIEPFKALAQQKAIHLTYYEEVSTLLMDFDEKHLPQILNNLLSNALKFTPVGGEILVHIKKTPTNDLQIKVKDNGAGIATADLENIFERFYQKPQRPSANVGTGIGLTLTKELVELMDGKIEVASTPGQGTTFTVLLPIKNNAAIKQLQSATTAATPPTPMLIADEFSMNKTSQRPQILLIEDHPDVIHLLQLTLQDQYEIYTATNGQQGLATALQTIPDLVISDVMMPIMDGLTLCNQLKKDEKTSHIPVILLTAKATKAHQIEGLTQGADAYLIKPFDTQELLVRVEQLLANRRKLQAYYLKWNPFQQPQTPAVQPDPFLLKVTNIIEKNLSDSDFGVLQLCHQLHLSRMQVHRKLKAVCNKSTAQFIREMRLQKAQQLLTTSDSTIAEIAYAVGFTEPNYFTKVFKDFYRQLPSDTRK